MRKHESIKRRLRRRSLASRHFAITRDGAQKRETDRGTSRCGSAKVEKQIEKAYATHFLDPKRIEEIKTEAESKNQNRKLWKTKIAVEMEFFCSPKTVDILRHFAYNKDEQVAMLAALQREVPLTQEGGGIMATSSIFTNIVISDPKKAEKFIDALEASSRDPEWKPTTPVKPPLTDIEAIRRLMAKRVQKK